MAQIESLEGKQSPLKLLFGNFSIDMDMSAFECHYSISELYHPNSHNE